MTEKHDKSVGASLVGLLSSCGVQFLKGTILIYRYTLSPLLGPTCRFSPSCSSYALAAMEKYGVFRGVSLTLVRLAKCHPWHPGGIDPVP